MTTQERLLRLEKHYKQMNDRLNLYAEQLVEANLRIRFVMSSFTMTRPKPGGMIDPATDQPVLETSNLYIEYMSGGREKLLDELEIEMRQVNEAMEQIAAEEALKASTENGQSPHLGEGEGEAPGDQPGSEPEGGTRTPADHAGAELPHRRSLFTRLTERRRDQKRESSPITRA